jgi:carboxylesterase type B
MADDLLGGVLGGEDEKPEVEAPQALAGAEAFAAAVAARLSGNDPGVARKTEVFLEKQAQLLDTQRRHLEDEHALTGCRAYDFDRHSPQAPLGPAHGAEVVCVFGNLTSNPRLGLTGTPEPEDLTLSKQIQDYWVNFARTGDPNGPGLPRWPAFSASSPRAMYLDVRPHDGPVPNLKQMHALETAYARGRQERMAAARAAR